MALALALAMAMAAAATTSLKLLVDSKSQRVLFAEAGKDVVDFLFSLLTLPVGTVVKLLTADCMVGCVGNIYGSVEKLDATYVQRGATKDALLRPAVLSPAASSLLGLPAASAFHPAPAEPPKSFYTCSRRCNSSDYGFGKQPRQLLQLPM
ncbi:uncharacterized protein LOC112268529, partial [Brachypodium distachyon]|uniref:uncharacterized protein LOC112268529 n=1 Tax=Brachypodium distachyon TaxID=15368 RepID=UPI000D0D1769